MNKTELQQVRDALSMNRVMARDADGNYTREVTPKLITDALALIDADLARVVGPVARVDADGFIREVSDMPIAPGTLLYATPQAAAQPSQAVELSDDPLQGAIDWFLQADGEFFSVATVQRTLRIGYNRAKRLCDIAQERAAINAKGTP